MCICIIFRKLQSAYWDFFNSYNIASLQILTQIIYCMWSKFIYWLPYLSVEKLEKHCKSIRNNKNVAETEVVT